MSKNKIFFLSFLVIVMAGGAFLYRRGFFGNFLAQEIEISSAPTAGSKASASLAASVSAESSEMKKARQEAMRDMAQKIEEIAPEEASLGGHWFVTRFWFVAGSVKDFYVEYEDGHDMRRILIGPGSLESGFKYEPAAYFEPGESDWVLKTGTDTQFDKSLDLYEYDEAKKEWAKKN